MRVSLGGFELKEFEKPDLIGFGGKQILSVREFPGGNTSIQNMGPTYRPISWSGTFIGKDAYDRMMKIGLMRTAGKPIELVTDKFRMDVIIEEFYPDYKTDNRIPFSITVRRIIDNTKNLANKDPIDLVINKVQTDNKNSNNSSKDITDYVVKSGDTLYKIASKYLKNPNHWEVIYADNKANLKDGPHKLKVGTKLVIRNV